MDRKDSNQPNSLPRGKNRSSLKALAMGLGGVAGLMLGLSFAAVPLYRAFCLATGFDGTARRLDRVAFPISPRKITVRFDTNVRDLPWDFTPQNLTETIRLGQPNLAYFIVTNKAKRPLTGRARYNIFPEAAAPYFIKTQCFCFQDQTIGPGKTVSFPVVYYINPRFLKDDSTSDLTEITLSYSFYPIKKNL